MAPMSTKITIILLTIISLTLLPMYVRAFTLSQLVNSVEFRKSSTAMKNALAKLPTSNVIEQSVSHVLNEAKTAAGGLNNQLISVPVADKLSRSLKTPGKFALPGLNNDLISMNADTVKGMVNTVVAKTLEKANPTKIIPDISNTLNDAVRKTNLNQIVDAKLHQRIGNVVSKDHLDKIINRAQTLRSGKPGEQFGSDLSFFQPSLCSNPSASQYLNLTSMAYDYPENSINLELHQRPEVMLDIFRSRRPNLKDPPVQTEVPQCYSTKETLEAFYVQGVKCWLVFPRHQNVQFYRCRKQVHCRRRQKGFSSVCTSYDDVTPLWAWCNTTFGGHKIIKFQLPLPVNCSCGLASSC